MKTMYFPLFVMLIAIALSCSDNETEDPPPNNDPGMYFPQPGSNSWETYSPAQLEWNTAAEQDLYDFLETNDTKAFIIVKDGRIVVEKYFNNTTASNLLPWFSAAKTLTATLTGIAQEEGYLDIDDPTSDYLGQGWTSMTPEQESAISIRHQLTMTTGLDYTMDPYCTDVACLVYLNDPGAFWYYHNAPYTLLSQVIPAAVGQSFSDYFSEKIGDVIGMEGLWVPSGYNNIYFSTARSMARFGLVALNHGSWGETPILSDETYFDAMVNTSQDLNEAYGFLWWLNGKSSLRAPGSIVEYPGKLIPSAPDDLIAGLGANDQKMYVVPSQNLVIVRMGGDAGEAQLGPSSFDEMLWVQLNAFMGSD